MGYVDDLRYMLPLLKLDLWWDKSTEQLLYSEEEHVQDILQCMTRTEKSMNLSKETMNSVVEDMEFTVEVGTEFRDNYLPTLDFYIRLEWCEEAEVPYPMIKFRFFQKPIARNQTIYRPTAMSDNSIKQTVTNEVIRRLKNMSTDSINAERVKVVNEYTDDMTRSGYEHKEIVQLVEAK